MSNDSKKDVKIVQSNPYQQHSWNSDADTDQDQGGLRGTAFDPVNKYKKKLKEDLEKRSVNPFKKENQKVIK